MKRFLAVLVAVFAVSSAWAGYVYRYVASINGRNEDKIVILEKAPSPLSDFGYNEMTKHWNWYMYTQLGEYEGPPEWMEDLGVKPNVTVSNLTYDEDGNLTGWEIGESYDLEDVPWANFGITYNGEGSLFPGTLSYNGITLAIDGNTGNLSFEGHSLGVIDGTNPTGVFNSLAGIKDTVLAADGNFDRSADKHNGSLPFYGTDSDGSRKTYYYDPKNNMWYDWSGKEYGVPVSDPWGLSSSSGGDSGDSGDGGDSGGDGGGSSSGGGSSGGDGGGSSSGGGSSGGDGGGSTGGGGDSSDGDGDNPPTPPPEDLEYNYTDVLNSMDNTLLSIDNQIRNGFGEYSESKGSSTVNSADGSSMSSASRTGLSGVSGSLDGLSSTASSGWSSVSSNLFGWVSGFSSSPPSMLSLGAFDFDILGKTKHFDLTFNIAAISDWLLLIRRAFILLWTAITVCLVVRLFRFLCREIVKGIRWLLGVIPKAFQIVATGS